MEKLKDIIKPVYKSIPYLTNFPTKTTWIDYDKEADVLYINFEKPQKATDSILEGDVLIRKRKNRIIGLTILNASKFKR